MRTLIIIFSFLMTSVALAESVTAPTIIPATPELRADFLKKLDASDNNHETERLRLLVEITQTYDMTSLDKDAIMKRYTAIKKKASQHADDHELKAAFGALTSYISSYFNDDYSRLLLYSRRGMRLMDSAVKKAPNHLGVRMQRGIANASMPKFLNRSHMAIEDSEFIKKHGESIEDPSFEAMIDYHLATAYKKHDEERKAVKLYQEIMKNKVSPWAKKSELAMSEL